MDLSSITTIISSLGFPIAVCVYLFYSQQKQAEAHKEEIDKLRTTVENNTKVMIKLCTKMGVDVDED